MYERFTDRARNVIQLANREAKRFNLEYVTTEHLLLGLLQETSSIAANALRNLEIDLGKLYQELEKKIVQPDSIRFVREPLPQSPSVKQVIADAVEEAELLDSSYVGTEHLLLALVRQKESVAGQVLIRMGLKLEDVRGEVLRLLGREIPVEKSCDITPLPKPAPSSAKPDSLVAKENEPMYERFTDRARKVMQLANQEAQRFNHEYIGTEHILLGLVKEGAGVAANVLKNLDIDLRKIRLEVEKIILPGPDMVTIGRLPRTPRAKKVIDYAIEEARSLNHNYVGTEHLLLGLLREEDTVGAQVLMNLGLELSDVRNEVLDLLGCKVAPYENHSGRTLVRRCLKGTRNQDGVPEKKNNDLPQEDSSLSKEQLRIRSLEQQLWNVRVVLGALVGALTGVLLFASLGTAIGLLVGGVVAALGWRSVGILAGGGTGALLGCVHLAGDGGGFAGALLGALAGFLIADIGRASERRRFPLS